MPDPLTKSEVTSGTDPSVSKQYDTETPKTQQVEEFYSFVDGLKSCLFGTTRAELGQVSRAMAVAKREGPTFLFLANKNSRKFEDLENSKKVQLTFQDSSSQNWASITGTAVTASNDDPRIKDLVNPFASAWFGDLGDGVHNGKAEDPRMSLIEVKTEYVTYWLSKVGTLGFFKEIAQANLTGKVANTGITRELSSQDFK